MSTARAFVQVYLFQTAAKQVCCRQRLGQSPGSGAPLPYRLYRGTYENPPGNVAHSAHLVGLFKMASAPFLDEISCDTLSFSYPGSPSPCFGRHLYRFLAMTCTANWRLDTYLQTVGTHVRTYPRYACSVTLWLLISIPRSSFAGSSALVSRQSRTARGRQWFLYTVDSVPVFPSSNASYCWSFTISRV